MFKPSSMAYGYKTAAPPRAMIKLKKRFNIYLPPVDRTV